MSLPFQLTAPSLHRHHSTHRTKIPTNTISRTLAVHKSLCNRHTNRRTTLFGLSLLPILTTNQASMANGVPPFPLQEFGSEPRPLTETIRVIVPRPKRSDNRFGDIVEVLKVQGVEVPNDDPVRFDVYVAKLDGDKVGGDLGELAGSLIQESRLRNGRYFTGLNLGITNLVKEIGGEGCENLVVSLVPRMGELNIGGVRIDHVPAE